MMRDHRIAHRFAGLLALILLALGVGGSGCCGESGGKDNQAPSSVAEDTDRPPPPTIIIEPDESTGQTDPQPMSWKVDGAPAIPGDPSNGKINGHMFGKVEMTADTAAGDPREIEHAILLLASGKVLVIRRYAPNPHSAANINWIEWRLDKLPLGSRPVGSEKVLPSDILGPVLRSAEGPEIWVTLADTGETLRATRIAINE